jgi:aminoglycoside phosphotransferase (APT) family kinase protein
MGEREPDDPLIALEPVRQLLDAHGLGEGELAARRIGEGSSNVTFLLRRGDARWVLRRPPAPPLPPSAHNVVREALFQRVLYEQGIRVPAIHFVYERDDVLGVPFYVMEHLGGEVLTERLPAELGVTERRALGLDLVDVLAAIHSVDVTDPAVASLARKGNYLERQVTRFGALWQQHALRPVLDVGEVEHWLRMTMPEPLPSTIVHGDFRLGNVMADCSAGRVAAVLDWEMAAVGDPRADLGYLIATWSDADSHGTALELSPVTALEGFPSRSELVALYEERRGEPVEHLAWFEVLALWKAAIFCEAIYGRHLRGEVDSPFARSLETGVPGLAKTAATIAART